MTSGEERQVEARWPSWVKPCVAGVLSLVLLAAFYLLRFTPSHMGAAELIDLSGVQPQEFNFWLGYTFLATPAVALGAIALERPLVATLRTVHRAATRASPRELKLALALFALMFAGAAIVGRDVLLDGVSVVDDEEAVRFGGRILATGHVFVDDTSGLLRNMFEMFMYWKGTHVASFDFLGIQLVHAFAEATGLGSTVFAALASLALVGVAVAAHERLGRRGALVAPLLLVCSPMFVALSLTVQAHLVSRTFIALSYAALAIVFSRPSARAGAALGFFLGCAFITRPPEATMLMAPLVLLLFAKAARSQPLRRAVAIAAAFALPPLLAMLAHNYALTGGPFRLARLDLAHSSFIWPKETPFLVRYGNQIGHDGMLLMLFSFGAVGAILVALGAFYDAFTLAAAAGVALVFAMGLLHADYGVHIVGPIHQSDCVIPLCLLATHGLFRLQGVVRAESLLRLVALVGGTICAASIVFLTVHLPEMHDITHAHRSIEKFIRDQTQPTESSKVVVIAPAYLRVLNLVPGYRDPGSWVNGWPRPRPDLADDLMVLTVEPDVSHLTLYRADLPLSPDAARATPIPVPAGAMEWEDKKWLGVEEAALAGRIRARFPERRIFKLVIDKAIKLVAIP